MAGTNVYQLTVFNSRGTELYCEQSLEYPEDPELESGQWFDICTISESDIDDDNDWLIDYLLNEIPGEDL